MTDFYATHLGPHRFHNNNDFMYLPPSDPSIQKITEKEKVCSCPLCHGDGKPERFITIGKFAIDEMIDEWVKRAKFNPIADVYRHSFLEERRCLNCGLHFYNYHLPDSALFYEKLMDNIDYYTQFRWEYGSAAKIIGKLKPKSLLDIGAGHGAFLERIRYMVPHIVASEYNQKAEQVCREKGFETYSEDISVINEKFDIVCAFEVMEHVHDNAIFMKNCLNLLKENGVLIFGMPDPDGMLTVNGGSWLNIPPHHQYKFSYQAFQYLAKKYQLKIIAYQKSELTYNQYARYAQALSKKELTAPDISGYLEAKKQYTGHSHFVAFQRQNKFDKLLRLMKGGRSRE